jgi:hypothetical protein
MTLLWPEQRVTSAAFKEVDTGVDRHGFDRRYATVRAGNDGLQNGLRVHCVALKGEVARLRGNA